MKARNSIRKKPNVLAVDDYPANLIALSVSLGADCNVIEANSGGEAIEILKTRKDIDVILMDIQMPDLDGYQTASRIKKMEGCEDIPIIFITAVYREEPFIKKGYEAGGIDYFSKPFDPEILKMKVNVYASFRQKTKFLEEREQQIRDTEELLRAGRKLSMMLESLPVGVLIADTQGRICQTNDQVSRICKGPHSSEGNFYGEAFGWWDSAEKKLKQSGPLYKAIQSGESSHSQRIQFQCSPGETKTILGSAYPLLGLDGHIVGAVVIIQDFTETKKIESDMEDRITRLVTTGLEIEESLNH